MPTSCSLAMVAEWTSTPPARAGLSLWFGWVVQHEIPGLLAVCVALFPAALMGLWAKYSGTRWGQALRGVLVVSGLSLVTWMPVPVGREGAAALGNELLGFGHFPPSWGAVAPPDLGAIGLALRWGFQFLLLGLLTILIGVWPEATLKPLTRSSAARARVSAPAPSPEPGSNRVVAPPPARASFKGPT